MHTSSHLIRRIYDSWGTPLLVTAVGCLFVLEKRFALRKQHQPLAQRLKTNIAMVSAAVPALRLALIPAMVHAAVLARNKGWGLLNQRRIPIPLAAVLGFAALDWVNYEWHRLNHCWPLLWKFHQVHHSDLDMDLSTALRFHVGELFASVPFKGGMVLFLGASPRTTLVYEIAFELANNFHHSNLRLPKKIDRALTSLLVTPRMHGIHHSIISRETNSNYSVIFTLWDRLRGSLRLEIPQESITIGLPEVRRHQPVKELMLMPFTAAPA